MQYTLARCRLALALMSLCISSQYILAQKHTISGYVTDQTNGERLLNAAVFDANTKKGTLTNNYGFFSLTLGAGPIKLVSTYAGFTSLSHEFILNKDTVFNIELNQLALDEVEIVAEELEREVEKTQMSVVDIPIDQIKRLPALLGEVDVIKALQYMPGVQSGNEGSTGLYVRGGGPDQNLILLDGVPLYYVSHLGGFFSVFNADALSSVQLYKGGFPARYGERLSSILDIRMKEGNMKKFEGEGSLGIISAKLSLQGPVIKDKSAFIISGRRTYIDLLTRPLSRLASGGEGSVGYYFYDLNGKYNHILSKKDRVYFSFYLGDDRLSGKSRVKDSDGGYSYDEKFKLGLGWGNRLAAFRWNHIWNSKLFSNLTATYTRYQLRTDADGTAKYTEPDTSYTDRFTLDYRSQIRDFGLKLDFDFYPSPAHEIRFGAFTTNHRFEPSTLGVSFDAEGEKQDTSVVSKIDYTWETGVYIEDNIKIGSRFSMNLGARATHYSVDGQQSLSIQARTAARFQISDNISIKASYSQMTQYIHLLTNSGLGLPIDLWVPATDRVPEQNSWQAAGGLSFSLWKNQFALSIEGYYKEMDGLISLKEGNNFFFGSAEQESWEDIVETGGEGEAYGVELLLQKKRGRTTGWLGYTLSWNWRQFDNLNDAKRFPFKYDRRHDISLVVTHKISDRVSIAGTWVFGTGNAISLPTGGYATLQNDFLSEFGFSSVSSSVPNNSELLGASLGKSVFHQILYDITSSGGVEVFENGRNGFRMQAYHRLDLGIEFTKPTRWGERTWSFGVYNAYSRLNPYVYYFENKVEFNTTTGDLTTNKKLVKLALFPIIPSIAYKFKF